MRPIDADKIEFLGLNNRVCPDLSAMDVIDEQPTVDAVPVVRCSECKFLKPFGAPNKMYCAIMQCYPNKDFYCGAGERKDGENERKR